METKAMTQSLKTNMNITPAMQQYYDIKKNHSDSILFFRMGDFYEMFEDDAKIAHKILGIALTTRNKNAQNPILLAWIPYHAKEKYLPMLIKSWYKVAIAEQVSDPKLKGIVEREVVRVITPWTLSLEWESYEQEDISPVIVSLVQDKQSYGLSVVNLWDHSWKCSEFHSLSRCAWELYKLSPSEVIIEKGIENREEIHEILSKKYRLNIYYYEFNEDPYTSLCAFFWSKNLEWFWIESYSLAQKASAIILAYIKENQQVSWEFLWNLSYESYSDYMDLDEATIRSLDLVYNIATNSSTQWTLFWALNQSKTPMGKRQLRSEILHPLQSMSEIQRRQKIIQALKTDTILLDKIHNSLSHISDIDALLSRISLERLTPRDLLSLKKSLKAVKAVYSLIEESDNKILKQLIK